nr:MAG TPA: hypothetical protein [Bacteriophage sp.]
MRRFIRFNRSGNIRLFPFSLSALLSYSFFYFTP